MCWQMSMGWEWERYFSAVCLIIPEVAKKLSFLHKLWLTCKVDEWAAEFLGAIFLIIMSLANSSTSMCEKPFSSLDPPPCLRISYLIV